MKKFYALLVLLICANTQPLLAGTELTITYTYKHNVFDTIFQEFSQNTGIKIKSTQQDELDLKAELVINMESSTTADAIIVPADHIGLHEFVKYSEIDPALFKNDIPSRIWDSGFSDGKLYGAPVVQGNHLMLFYNKALIKQPATDWDGMYKQKDELTAKGFITIAWAYDTPYWLVPFLGAYGGSPIKNSKADLNTPAMAAALNFYKKLYTTGLVHPDCNYQCSIDLFKAGKLAYTINGDWTGNELHNVLGENLGAAAMPMIGDRKMVPTFSTHLIAFPNDSLNGKKRATLIQLVNYLQSPAIQRRIWDLGGFTPVETSALDYAHKNAKGYLKQTLELMDDAKPVPADQIMSLIWYAIDKGMARHRNGTVDGANTAVYIQRLAERHIQNAQRPTKSNETNAVKAQP